MPSRMRSSPTARVRCQGGIYGNVDVETGLILVGPAMLGVIAGTAIQQRIPEKAVSLLFAILLIGVGIEMIVG